MCAWGSMGASLVPARPCRLAFRFDAAGGCGRDFVLDAAGRPAPKDEAVLAGACGLRRRRPPGILPPSRGRPSGPLPSPGRGGLYAGSLCGARTTKAKQLPFSCGLGGVRWLYSGACEVLIHCCRRPAARVACRARFGSARIASQRPGPRRRGRGGREIEGHRSWGDGCCRWARLVGLLTRLRGEAGLRRKGYLL